VTSEERKDLRKALIPNFPGATANAVEWLITLLARVEILEKSLDKCAESADNS